jgi:hypothetical protein
MLPRPLLDCQIRPFLLCHRGDLGTSNRLRQRKKARSSTINRYWYRTVSCTDNSRRSEWCMVGLRKSPARINTAFPKSCTTIAVRCNQFQPGPFCTRKTAVPPTDSHALDRDDCDSSSPKRTISRAPRGRRARPPSARDARSAGRCSRRSRSRAPRATVGPRPTSLRGGRT